MSAAEPRDLLLGRLAVRRRCCTPEQVQEGIHLQQHGDRRPLGEILVDCGSLTPAQLEDLLADQRKSLAKSPPGGSGLVRDALLGQMAIREGLASKEDVHAALREQGHLAESGHSRRLGEVLVERGILTAEQVRELLRRQDLEILRCPGCGTLYNVRRYRSGKQYRCRRCDHELVPPARIESPEVAGTVTSIATVRPPSMPEGEAADAREPGTDSTRHDLPAASPPPESSPPAPYGGEIPDRLGEFEVRREVGRGAMGIVYEGWQPTLQRRVAIKVLPFSFGSDRTSIERFHREARAAAKLRHPNIVQVITVGETNGLNYYVMNFVEGESVESLIARERISFVRAARIGMEICKALQEAHKEGVIHRDIKPGNILLAKDGRTLLTDFGLAMPKGDMTLTMSGQAVGTPLYMSPEQASAVRAKVDHRSDLYALGATLYEMIAGRPPYTTRNLQMLLAQILTKPVPPPRTVNTAVPKSLETIVLRALAKDPADRYPSASAMGRDLHRFVQGQEIETTRPRISKRQRKRLARQGTTAGLAAAAVALLLLVVLGNREKTDPGDPPGGAGGNADGSAANAGNADRSGAIPAGFDVDAEIQRAERYGREKAWDAALEVYRRVVEGAPERADAWYGIAHAEYRREEPGLERYERARRALLEVEALDPNRAGLYPLLGDVYQGLSLYEKAVEAYSEALRRGTEGTERALLYRARAGMHAGLAEDAAEAREAARFRREAARDLESAETVYLQLGEGDAFLDERIDTLETLVRIEPGLRAYLTLGDLHLRRSELLGRRDPNGTDAIAAREAALGRYVAALNLDPADAEALRKTCEQARVLKRHDVLIPAGEAWTRADPRSAEAHRYLAEGLFVRISGTPTAARRREDLDRYLATLRTSLGIEDHPIARWMLARTVVLANGLEREWIEHLDAALPMLSGNTPMLAQGYHFRGICRAHLGDEIHPTDKEEAHRLFALAIEDFERSLAEMGNHPYAESARRERQRLRAHLASADE